MARTTSRRSILIALLLAAIVAGLLTLALLATPVAAKPAFMERYNQDPYAKPTLKDKCSVCHISREGGERNVFGEAFADEGYRITADLRRQFPERFLKETAGPKP